MKKVKKVLSLILCSLLLIGLVPVAAQADDESEPPAVEAPEFSGSGTKEDPYQISSAEDLMHLAEFVNEGKAAEYDTDIPEENSEEITGNFHGYYFKQTADIDLTGKKWEPIGYSGSGLYFAGSYDGDNHTIINATSKGKPDGDGYSTAGIFGWVVFGSVSNLHVKNADFSATGKNNYAYVGGVVSVCFGSNITNCTTTKSNLTADRTDDNNTAVGGVIGYATGGSFEKCASISNTVVSKTYGGGLVGEIDNDYAGDSSFKNCYVTDGNVNAKGRTSGTFAGGFAGEVTDDTLAAQNCYVFNETIRADGTNTEAGVFAGNLWGENSTIKLTNCYYGKCGDLTNNAGSASLEKDENFSNGTITDALNKASADKPFAQGKNYPVFKDSPADYNEVDQAIKDANAKAAEKDLYTNFDEVEKAIAAVDRNKTAEHQADVDAMAKAITSAINALVRRADYSGVDKAIKDANAKASEENLYTNFDAVKKAIAAVDRNKTADEQSTVDAMAKAIEDAITSLQLKGADYTKVDAALEKVKALNKADYENFDAVEKAVNAVDRKKNITDQATVDKYAEDIEKAISSLKRKPDPSKEPTGEPPKTPSETLTGTPTPNPTKTPTTAPTSTPTTSPAKQPTAEPSKAPTTEPTKAPTTAPQSKPTAEPSVKPSTDTNKSAEKKETPLYRLYNPHSGEHFYTKEPGEKDALVKIGWKYEGQAWSSPETGIPVYRLYNPNAGDHFYTTSVGERKYLVKLGWKYEGIGWYAVRKGRAVYRLYNPNAKGAGSHHYTTSIGERAILIKLGWRAEGIAWDAI